MSGSDLGEVINSVRFSLPHLPASGPIRLLLVRHAESTWNGEGRLQGQFNPPLSPHGRWQAERLAARLADRPPRGLYSSDLQRALETAATLGRAWKLEPVPVAELREVHMGDWQGLDGARIAARYPDLFERWRGTGDWDLVPGGEGTGPFRDRVRVAIDKIVHSHGIPPNLTSPTGGEGGQEMVVVSHGAVINMLMASLLGYPPGDRVHIDNTSITILELDSKGWLMNLHNCTAHLDG